MGFLRSYQCRLNQTPLVTQNTVTGYNPTLFVASCALYTMAWPHAESRIDAGGVTCCPSRVSIMSGRFAARFHQKPGHIGKVGFDVGRKTVTSLLKGVGYQVSHFGKVRN